jgi:hypothetical protein
MWGWGGRGWPEVRCPAVRVVGGLGGGGNASARRFNTTTRCGPLTVQNCSLFKFAVDNLDGWLARLIAFPLGFETLQSPLARRFIAGWLYFVDGRVVISPVAVTTRL